MNQSTLTIPDVKTRPIRLGVVSFVNTLPLIDGLESLTDIKLRFSVPSLLLGMLLEDEVDIALCSSIDYQNSPIELVALTCGILGSDGATLTVRLYSSVKLSQIKHVYCDTDSHTSIVLMQILLKEIYGITPKLIDYNAREHVAENKPIENPEAMLLIGDKVVTDSPKVIEYPYQLDLGGAWFEHTGLPFVFAMWLAKQTTDIEKLKLASAVLDRQRRYNQLDSLDRIVHQRAKPRNWPGDIATDYLTNKLAFEFTDKRREGLELFYDKAFEHGLVEKRQSLRLVRK